MRSISSRSGTGSGLRRARRSRTVHECERERVAYGDPGVRPACGNRLGRGVGVAVMGTDGSQKRGARGDEVLEEVTRIRYGGCREGGSRCCHALTLVRD
jgi:hypothetical protein